MPRGVVLADAGYGNDHAFREGVSALGLRYVAGVGPTTSVWGPGVEPLAPKAYCGRGIKPTRLRYAPGHAPVSIKALAMGLAPNAFRQTLALPEDYVPRGTPARAAPRR